MSQEMTVIPSEKSQDTRVSIIDSDKQSRTFDPYGFSAEVHDPRGRGLRRSVVALRVRPLWLRQT